MHCGNLWRYIFPATRVSCFLLWRRLILSFTFRLLRLTQLVDEAHKESQSDSCNTVCSVFTVFFYPELIKSIAAWRIKCLRAIIYKEQVIRFVRITVFSAIYSIKYSGLTLLMRFSGLGRSCRGSFSAEINKSIKRCLLKVVKHGRKEILQLLKSDICPVDHIFHRMLKKG